MKFKAEASRKQI